jgi:hypothetical protein
VEPGAEPGYAVPGVEPGDAVPGAEEPAAGDAPAFRWTRRHDGPADRLFVTVVDGPEGPRFEIRIDTHFVPPAVAEALAHGMEAAAVEAVLTPASASPVR